MTVAAAGAAVASRARVPRSATLGALVFLAGGALVYWSLFRSRDGKGLFGLGANATRGGSLLEQAARDAGGAFGGGGSSGGGGGSGSFSGGSHDHDHGAGGGGGAVKR